MKKYFFKVEIRFILIDLSKIFPMKLSEFKFSNSVKSYDEKTDENYRNCYVAEKAHSFQTIKCIDPKM